MHGFFRKLKNSPAMIVAVIAVVFAMSGSAFAAKTLITGKDIKKGSITTQNLSKKTIKSLKGKKGSKGSTGATGATGAAGPQGPQGAPGATGATGAKGDTGAAGANGENGANGAQGDKGVKGDKGEPGAPGTPGTPGAPGTNGSFDATKITAATAAAIGFGPWRDSDASAAISFNAGNVKITTDENLVGLTLPIAQGTAFSLLETIDYTGATGDSKAPVLAIEVFTGAGRVGYTTVYRSLSTAGAITGLEGDGWTSTQDIKKIDADGAVVSPAEVLVPKNTPTTWSAIKGAITSEHATVLGATLRTGASYGDGSASDATISSVTVGLRTMPAVAYGFAAN